MNDSIDDFWSEPISRARVINRFVYRGRGRPKKTDYTTVEGLQILVNTALFWYLFVVKYGTNNLRALRSES